MDNTNFINASINEVKDTFVESLLLVILVVFVFLQKWRTTLIPVLAVPVSIVGTFASFKILDFTINTLTLFAMVLAIGLVVDDAIVVIENVEEHMSKDKLSAKDATEAAMKEVQGPSSPRQPSWLRFSFPSLSSAVSLASCTSSSP